MINKFIKIIYDKLNPSNPIYAVNQANKNKNDKNSNPLANNIPIHLFNL